MNRKYLTVLLAVALVLIVFRWGYSLALWGDSLDADQWRLLGDTNKYVITGHYSPHETQSMYYGAYSVGFEALLATLTVFTGIDLITFAQYSMQVATPLVMVAVAYLVSSRSGRVMNWGIPVMILFIGSFSGLTLQQSRMIEENMGFILFCGTLLFLYLYYTGRTSRLYTISMLTAILLVTIFTHHISFLVIAILAMPFLVSELKFAALAYIAAIFVPWWMYYYALNGYNGVYVGIYFYTTVSLVVLYTIFAHCYVVWRSKTRRAAASRALAKLRQMLQIISNSNQTYVAMLTLLLGAGAVAYSLATRLQSGYLPFFLPLAPLVVYTGAYAAIAQGREDDQLDITYTRYLVLGLIFLSVLTVLGLAMQFGAARAGTVPVYLKSVEELISVDLGSRFMTWTAFVYGLVATIGFILVSNGIHVTRRQLAPLLVTTLLILAAVNATVLVVNYDTSFSVTTPPDSQVIATALWSVGKDPDNATMTDYKDEMVYWYYASAPVTHTPLSDGTNFSVLDYVYPGYLEQWNSSGHTNINYLLLTVIPEKYYSQHLVNGEYKLVYTNVRGWQARVISIDNGMQLTADKIYTNGHTYYYKVIGS
jgi:hypothetical protein